MKLRYLASILGALCSLLHAHAQPLPARQTTLPGTYRISAGTQLSYETPLAPLAGYLREYINVGKASDSMSADDAIVLTTDPTLGSEAYTLAVKPQRIEITGGDYGGVFNGIQALLRLLPPEVYAKACPLPVEVACTRIDDAPRFAYRGMMLDVARTWIGVDGVKRYINLLSYHGINKLQLHLSDDEGWRIEIRSHPELTEIGGFRGGDSPVRPVYGKWDEKYGGFYTQDEMRGLIRYAAVRNIEIIPEIDLPGHSRNIASVHPEIRCNYPPDTLSTNGYDYRSAWCVARGHPGRTLHAVPLGIHPRGRRRGRHDPMEALPRLPGADAAAGHGRPAPTGRPLHATHGGDPWRQRQTPRRVERSGGDGRPGARQPRLRLAERQGMPRRHGQGIRDRSDAGRIFLFRHAPVAP